MLRGFDSRRFHSAERAPGVVARPWTGDNQRVQPELPTGTVTFLFTDVEGSTKLLHELGAEDYSRAPAVHRRILREAVTANKGVEVDTQGDAFFVAFPTAPGALAAAAEALDGLASGPIRVRVGIHTGTPHLGEEGYIGVDVHRRRSASTPPSDSSSSKMLRPSAVATRPISCGWRRKPSPI